jgi:predicted HD phosphohydrolase
MPTYYVYAVILHEIGHASYNFKHYDKQLDIMNSKCNIKASEFHQILDSFYMNPYKYKNIN